MNREIRFWTILFVVGAILLVYGQKKGGFGKVYVKKVETNRPAILEQMPRAATTEEPALLARPFIKERVETTWQAVEPKQAAEVGVELSWPRTIGVWTAALLTLAVFSYLFSDNPVYRVAEAVFVGVSAGYAMVVGFWDVLVSKLLVRLSPLLAKQYFLPDVVVLKQDSLTEFLQLLGGLIPVGLGLLLFARFIPQLSRLASWPAAVVVGTTAGLKLVVFLNADFVNQINSSIMPLVVVINGQIDFWKSVQNSLSVVGTIAALSYFVFSVDQRGPVRPLIRVGVWVLMITFGASFALTVMGRFTLLTGRLEFLLDDWLWLIDLKNTRPI